MEENLPGMLLKVKTKQEKKGMQIQCSKEMYNNFRGLGNIYEVVIPPKKYRRGKNYGFVRFKSIENIILMAVKLDNIIIEGRKIYANVLGFQINNGGFQKKKRI